MDLLLGACCFLLATITVFVFEPIRPWRKTPMGVDLRMEPYAEMFEKERPGLRIIDGFVSRTSIAVRPSWDEVGRLLH